MSGLVLGARTKHVGKRFRLKVDLARNLVYASRTLSRCISTKDISYDTVVYVINLPALKILILVKMLIVRLSIVPTRHAQ